MEIFYIPREDLTRAPGYSGQGVFLPLSQILALVADATSHSATAPTAHPPVYCTGLELDGVLSDALTLSGTLAFEAPGHGWSATRIDDGTLPWISQSPGARASSPATTQSVAPQHIEERTGASALPGNPQSAIRNPQFLPGAFLARVSGATYLFAQGPARGVMHLRALLPVPLTQADTTLALGCFDAPCTVAITMAADIQLTSASMPAFTAALSNTFSGAPTVPTRLTLWPAQGRPGWLRLRRQAPLLAPSSLRVTLSRTVGVRGAALEVTDDLTLEDRFTAGQSLRLGLPAGLRLLRAEAIGQDGRKQPATVETTTDTLILRPTADLAVVSLRAVFAAELSGGQARPGGWTVPGALVQFARLNFVASPDFIPVALDLPPQVRPAGAGQYLCEGPLPALGIDLVRRTPAQPPSVRARLRIERGEASAETTLSVAETGRRDLRFQTPSGWVLTDLNLQSSISNQLSEAERTRASALPGNPQSAVRATLGKSSLLIQQFSPTDWAVSWDPRQNPIALEIKLHRAGAWGAPGTTATLELPLLRLEGPRPLVHEFTMDWPDQLDVRIGELRDMEVASDLGPRTASSANPPSPSNAQSPERTGPSAVPVNPQSAIRNPQSEERTGPSALPGALPVLRATGDRPAGTLLIRGREADVRATVVAALAVAEDQVRVRALLEYRVTNAPASVFRFRLPAGTGQAVKISGDNIRESTLRATPGGDEWTVVTQDGVLGVFPLTLEWPLAARAGAGPIDAPAIRPLGVTAQQGFIVLESSETLLLAAQAAGLAETDLADVPAVPWRGDSRILRAWRYIEPAFTLRVSAEKFRPEPPLAGLVREAALTTTIAPEGARLTRAEYNLMPLSDRQFFELRLPAGALLWSVLVDGQGVKPARRPDPAGGTIHLVPLPAVTSQTDGFKISVLYQENAAALARATRLDLQGPTLSDPVGRTTWNLNLPSGFEYLTYGGMANAVTVRVPLSTLLRTTYYPNYFLFAGEGTGPAILVVILTAIAAGLFLAIRHRILHPPVRRPLPPETTLETSTASEAPESSLQPSPSPPPPRPQGRGCFTSLVQWTIVGFIIMILAAISVPNFMEAQVRSKTARVKGDQRTLTVALETYYVDQNAYPTDPNVLWQGSVNYLRSSFTDPYADTANTPMHYLYGPAAVSAARAAGYVPPDMPENATFYLVYSVGPDGKDDGGRIAYDPTNGTSSAGDVIRTKDGGGPSFPQQQAGAFVSEPVGAVGADQLSSLAIQPSPAAQPAPAAPAFGAATYDPSDGPRSSGDVYRSQSRAGSSRGGRAAGEELVPLNIQLPKPRYIGTPSNLRTPNLEAQPAATEERLRRQGVNVQEKVEMGRSQRLLEEGPSYGAYGGGKPQGGRVYIYPDAFEQGALALGDKDAEELSKSLSELGGDARYAQGGMGGGGGKAGYSFQQMAKRQAGLLSLGIEIPQGGIQRSFETLGGKARLEIRLLEQNRFLRWNFMIWMAAFLAMAGLWLRSRRAWRIALVAGFAVTLLVPALFHTAWVVFFNTAFQGILFSLVVPLVAWGLGRVHARLGAGTVVFLFALILGQSARAGENDGVSGADEGVRAPRIFIPYDLTRPAWGEADPLAFLSKEDFARLWNAALPETGLGVPPSGGIPANAGTPELKAALTGLRLEGVFAPEDSAVHGTLTLSAINPTDAPTSLPLALNGLTLEGASADPPGAAIVTTSTGLLLRAGPRWAGEVTSRFVLRCDSQGSTGHLTLDLPEAAAGLWRFELPWRPVLPQGASAAACIAEATTQGTALVGPARPGRLDLSWSAGSAGVLARSSSSDWRAEIDSTAAWSTLSGAGWSARVRLEGIGGGLPDSITLTLDPGLRIHGATGEALRLTTIANDEITFLLAPARTAEIQLLGLVPPPNSPLAPRPSSPWLVPGLRVPAGVQARTTLRLDVDNALEILSLDPQGLERRSALTPRQGFASRLFEANAPDWRLSLELARPAPVFTVAAREVFALGAGFLRRAAAIELRPRDCALGQVRLILPPGTRAQSAAGPGLAAWTQDRQTLLLAFNPPRTAATTIDLIALADVAATSGALTLAPIEIPGSADVRRLAAMRVPPDFELQEVDMAGAAPRLPDDNDRKPIALLDGENGRAEARTPNADPELRGWTLASGAPLRLRLTPVRAAALYKVYNRVSVAEGIQTLDAVLAAEPRRGRLREVAALLRLSAPDPTAAARLRATGPVRHLRTEALNPRTLRAVVELDAPRADAFQVAFHFDQPAATDSGQPLRIAILAPEDEGGSRAFLLLRRQIEGELNPADLAGARAVDPAAVDWPDPSFRPLAADRVFELPARAATGPAFAIVRHARDEALPAYVDIMRHRSIVTADGLERNELEIVLQNQSLQFLKVRLPYPRGRVSIYEVQVASRVVKTTVEETSGRATLIIPLIRTGLLDPELSVRVAYVASGGAVFARSGQRGQQMPEVLEGIPVGQSTMVLMLPSEYAYSGFTGSMNRVELVDLETDEAYRVTRQVEKLSENVLLFKGLRQKEAVDTLNEYKGKAESKLKTAKQTAEAYGRNWAMNQTIVQDEQDKERQERLAGERAGKLKAAEAAGENALSNTIQVQERLKQELATQQLQPAEQVFQAPALAPPPAPTPAPTPAPAARGWVEFPRAGDVFAFRQLQGAGNVTFDYSARATADRRRDLALALGLTLLAALLVWRGPWLAAARRRILAVLAAICLAAVLTRTALDLAIPALAIIALVYFLGARTPPSAPPPSQTDTTLPLP